MTKSFLSANVVLALVFASALVFFASSSFAAQGLELRIDSDNNGAIDNSSWERELAKSPFAFGKFIPYSETDSEFVEFQVVLPKAKSVNEKRTLKFTFESNEVSLWEDGQGGKKERLFTPDVKNTTQAETDSVNNSEETKEATDDSDSEEQEEETTDQKGGSWLGFGQKLLKGVAKTIEEKNNLQDFMDRNIDEVPQEEPFTEIVEELKTQVFEYPKEIPTKETTLTFYLKAETKPLSSDWQNSRLFKRPTRTLTVDLILNEKKISTDNAQYMVVDKNSIYAAIQKQPLLSEAIASRAVYYTKTNVKKYGLQLLTLKDMGISSEDIHFDDSDFSVHFYRNWVHDKYYVVFRGTDIKISDIRNDVLLCMGKPSRYLWKALKLGLVLKEKLRPDVKKRFVIVGHSLGGALASGACIASGIHTDTFNALGLSYQTLKSSIDEYGANDSSINIYKMQIEKCFKAPQNAALPNDRKFIKESVPLFTFNTSSDILTLFEKYNQKAKLEIKDDTVLNIPLALGSKIKFPQSESAGQDNQIEKLRNVIKSFYFIVEQCDPNNQDSIESRIKKGLSIVGNDILGGKITVDEMQKQIDYSIQRHLMDAVIEEILIQSGMPEAYGKAGNRE